jgi:hypothetical protein
VRFTAAVLSVRGCIYPRVLPGDEDDAVIFGRYIGPLQLKLGSSPDRFKHVAGQITGLLLSRPGPHLDLDLDLE